MYWLSEYKISVTVVSGPFFTHVQRMQSPKTAVILCHLKMGAQANAAAQFMTNIT